MLPRHRYPYARLPPTAGRGMRFVQESWGTTLWRDGSESSTVTDSIGTVMFKARMEPVGYSAIRGPDSSAMKFSLVGRSGSKWIVATIETAY